MEDKIKILETKLKLAQDINQYNESLLYNLQEISTSVIDILNITYDHNSLSKHITHNFSREQKDILEYLIYTAKSKNLTSQRTKQSYKDYAREKEIKQEILNGL